MRVYSSGRALLFMSALALTACDVNVDKDIKPYVEAPVVLTAARGSNVFKGRIPFTETHYFTNYRTECDTVQCGWDTREVCTTVPRCTGTPRSCTTDSVCHDVPDTVCRTDSAGVEHCTTTTRRECSEVERCTGGGEVCHDDTVCHTVEEPRYCQVNCREVPFRDSRDISHASPVSVTVSGASSEAIKELVLGVKTTAAYSSIFHNTGAKSEKIEDVLKLLSENDKTLVVLRAKGLKLVDNASFLQLPPGFKAGDAVNFELKVQSSGEKSSVSALGTKVDFPALNWSTSE